MSVRTLPPRRQIPPPPPRRVAPPATTHATEKAEKASEDQGAPRALSIAARIANLQLKPGLQPSYPRDENIDHEPVSVVIKAQPKTFALVLAGLDPDYLSRLLARPPPPIPDKWSQERKEDPDHHPPPQLPPRRLPPRPPSPSQVDYDRTPYKNGISDPDTYHDDPTQEEEEEGLYQVYKPDSTITNTTTTAGEDFSPGILFPPGTCIKCHDFSDVDEHAARFPRQYVSSLDELADNLTGPFTYETEKARAIFTWLHHNIQYDTQSFFAGTVKPATPESTLSSGLAVCDGYAGLFVYLAERAGLTVYKVSGHGKGFGYRELLPGEPVPQMSHNHAWNCVLMDGEWRLIDATWGAGAVNGSTYDQRFDPSWFSSTPAEFGRRHFPSDPTFQLISDEEGGPITWEDYILRPPGPIIFSDFHRLEFLVDLLQPASDVIEYGQTVTFTLFKRCEHMSNRDADNYVYILHLPDGEPIPLEQNAEGGWSLTHRVSSQTEVSLMFVATVDGRDAKGVGIPGFNSALGRKPVSFGGLAKWTVA